MDTVPEDTRLVECDNPFCPNSLEPFAYPVDCSECPICRAELLEVTE